MPRRENAYQPDLIKEIKRRFPGCWVIKLDSGYMQGVPDWLILYEDKWAMLEIKREEPTSPRDFEPNQEWYLEEFNGMSFAACIYPENERDVLNALQQSFQPKRQARVPKR